MNIVYSLVELVGVASNKVDTKTLSEYANGLLISKLHPFMWWPHLFYNIVTLDLMPSCSAFSDHPSVVDMDIFNILVSWHFKRLRWLIIPLLLLSPSLPLSPTAGKPSYHFFSSYKTLDGLPINWWESLLPSTDWIGGYLHCFHGNGGNNHAISTVCSTRNGYKWYSITGW